MIEAQQIAKYYGNLQVLKDINLQVEKGEVISIVGPSGAGKSTLLHILGTLEKPDSGKVFIEDQDVFSFSSRKLANFRNSQLGFIFQFHHLLAEFSALENIAMPALIKGDSFQEASQNAKELMDFMGLKERMDHKPNELSGGEQQRVAVARALMNQPVAVLADEPTGNLDSQNAQDLHNLFFSLRDKFQQTFIIVTHNDELASQADRKISMKDGELQ